MTKRNIIDKFLRLASIRERYEDEIIELAKRQIDIDRKVIKELKLEEYRHQYPTIIPYDFIRIDVDTAVVSTRNSGCRGGEDELLSSFYIHHLVIIGDVEGYEKWLRETLRDKSIKAEEARQAQVHRRRQQLQDELARLST